MHALLCASLEEPGERARDWYDLVWYCAQHPNLHLAHLEQRLRQSGHWEGTAPLTEGEFREPVAAAIEELNVDQARAEVLPLVRQAEALDIWSREFFESIVRNIVIV